MRRRLFSLKTAGKHQKKVMVSLFIGLGLLLFPLQTCIAENLLANPGFEAGSIRIVSGSDRLWIKSGWTIKLPSVSTGTWDESFFSDGRGGGVEIHEGAEALRLFGFGSEGCEAEIEQVVPATPSTHYEASVWVRARDLHRSGFGHSDKDSIHLAVEEYDHAGGAIPGTLRTAEIRKANSAYEKLTINCFITTSDTSSILYKIYFDIYSAIKHGACTIDDCALKICVPAAHKDAKLVDTPATSVTLTGIVLGHGKSSRFSDPIDFVTIMTRPRKRAQPLEGATVRAGDRSTTTGPDGRYSITGMAPSQKPVEVHVSRRGRASGYYAERKYVTLKPGITRADFNLAHVEYDTYPEP
jgi:hypothetical protein